MCLAARRAYEPEGRDAAAVYLPAPKGYESPRVIAILGEFPARGAIGAFHAAAMETVHRVLKDGFIS